MIDLKEIEYNFIDISDYINKYRFNYSNKNYYKNKIEVIDDLLDKLKIKNTVLFFNSYDFYNTNVKTNISSNEITYINAVHKYPNNNSRYTYIILQITNGSFSVEMYQAHNANSYTETVLELLLEGRHRTRGILIILSVDTFTEKQKKLLFSENGYKLFSEIYLKDIAEKLFIQLQTEYELFRTL